MEFMLIVNASFRNSNIHWHVIGPGTVHGGPLSALMITARRAVRVVITQDKQCKIHSAAQTRRALYPFDDDAVIAG